jgi:hypothetical protein
MSRPQGSGKEEESDEQYEGQNRQIRDRPRRRIQGELTPGPQSSEQREHPVCPGENEKPTISRPNESPRRYSGVNAGDSGDQHCYEELDESHDRGEFVRRFKELVQSRKLGSTADEQRCPPVLKTRFLFPSIKPPH